MPTGVSSNIVLVCVLYSSVDYAVVINVPTLIFVTLCNSDRELASCHCVEECWWRWRYLQQTNQRICRVDIILHANMDAWIEQPFGYRLHANNFRTAFSSCAFSHAASSIRNNFLDNLTDDSVSLPTLNGRLEHYRNENSAASPAIPSHIYGCNSAIQCGTRYGSKRT
jgi:hypothetical protein